MKKQKKKKKNRKSLPCKCLRSDTYTHPPSSRNPPQWTQQDRSMYTSLAQCWNRSLHSCRACGWYSSWGPGCKRDHPTPPRNCTPKGCCTARACTRGIGHTRCSKALPSQSDTRKYQGRCTFLDILGGTQLRYQTTMIFVRTSIKWFFFLIRKKHDMFRLEQQPNSPRTTATKTNLARRRYDRSKHSSVHKQQWQMNVDNQDLLGDDALITIIIQVIQNAEYKKPKTSLSNNNQSNMFSWCTDIWETIYANRILLNKYIAAKQFITLNAASRRNPR